MSDTAYVPVMRAAEGPKDGRWHLLAAGLSLLFALLCTRWPPLLAFEAAAALAILTFCAVRPYLGFLMVVGLVMAVDQNGISTNGVVEIHSITNMLHLYENLNTVAGIPGIYLNAMELMLVVCAVSWIVRRLREHTLHWQGGFLAPQLALLAGVLLWALARGIAKGGEWNTALWETRGLFQMIALYFIAAHMVERESQVRALLWAAIAGILVRVCMTWWYAGALLHFNLSGVATVTAHEDALFFSSLLVLWACLELFRTGRQQRLALRMLVLALAGALFASKRRAAITALLAAPAYLFTVLDWRRARRVAGIGLALALPTLAYCAAFWNSTSGAGMPVQLVRSVFDTKSTDRMGSSNLYRLRENRILLDRIREKPAVGIGFGQPFGVSVETPRASEDIDPDLPKLGFALWRYVPHNQILWMWVKAGMIGFAAFWWFVTVALAQGVHLVRVLKNPYFRAVAATVTILVCMQMVVSFADQQLTDYRNMVYLGSMLGMMSRLRTIEARAAADSQG